MNRTDVHRTDGTSVRSGATIALPDATDPGTAGRKAASLARLLRAGARVPDGFVVPEAMLAGDERTLRRALEDGLAGLGGGPVAVRSSSVDEDRDDASFAGQYDTVLGAEGVDEVATAVAAVYASREDAARRGYVTAAGGDAPMAVLVQRLVPADAAGVAFSANPVTGDRDEVLVSAVRGLGDRLVSGEAAPDEWAVRDGRAVCRTRPEGAVDDAAVLRVAELARTVEDGLGGPADIEWALAGDELYLLQGRPITVLPTPPTIEPPAGPWFKDTTHFLEPVAPLTSSIYIPIQSEILPGVFDRFGLLLDTIRFETVGYEVYGQPVPVGGPADGPTPPWWLMGLLARIVPPLRRRVRTSREVVATGLPQRTLARWADEWRPLLQDRIDALRAVELPDLDDDGLEHHLDQVLELMRDGQRIHFELFIPYVMALHDLATLVDELIGWPMAEVVTLVGGLSHTTAEPGRALIHAAQVARTDPEASAVLADRSAPPDQLLEHLRDRCPDVGALVDRHLERFGLRLLGYDLGSATLAERPDIVLRTLRDLVEQPEAGADVHRSLAAQRDEAAVRARAAMDEADASVVDRGRFEQALAEARAAWPVREDNLLYTDGLPGGLLRRAVLEVGRRLVARGRLVAPTDVELLEHDELRTLLRDDDLPGPSARERVSQRRAEMAWVRAHPGPQGYGPEPGDPPDLRALPEAVRRTTGALLWMMAAEFDPEAAGETDDGLRGTPGSPGRAEGTARVLSSPDGFDRLRPGDVLVCPVTNPAWSVVFPTISALVADGGGVLAHAAILAREFAIPAVLATGVATQRLHDGDRVVVDGTAGTVRITDCPHREPAPGGPVDDEETP